MKITDEITADYYQACTLNCQLEAWVEEKNVDFLWRGYTICMAWFHGTSVKKEAADRVSSFAPWKEPRDSDTGYKISRATCEECIRESYMFAYNG